jgi:broad specificity phosphatase PhoE
MDLSPAGAEHAAALAARLQAAAQPPTVVYCSPFKRAARTAHIVAAALGVRVRVEQGLTEWLSPALVGAGEHQPATAAQLARDFPSIDASYRSVHAAAFPESERALLARSAATLQKLLAAAKGESMLVVSHAPVNQV